jgi:hypothetical protein
VLESARLLLREDDDLPGSLCESLEHCVCLVLFPPLRLEGGTSAALPSIAYRLVVSGSPNGDA